MIKSLRLFLATFLSIGLLSFVIVPAASAASDFDLFGNNCTTVGESEVCGPCKGNQDATVCQDSKDNSNPIWGSGSVVEVVVNILALIIGVAAVIIIIIAGIQYMVSTGDPTKVNNAKNAILYAVIGLVVAVLARFVVPFVLGKL
jgi:hypothetical protein